MSPVRRCTSTLLLLVAMGLADPAAAIFGDVDEAFGIEGSFRSIGAVTINYDDPVIFPNGEKADAFLQAPLRIVVAGKPTEKWSYTTHAVQFVSATTYDSASSGGATLPASASLPAPRDTVRSISSGSRSATRERHSPSDSTA